MKIRTIADDPTMEACVIDDEMLKSNDRNFLHETEELIWLVSILFSEDFLNRHSELVVYFSKASKDKFSECVAKTNKLYNLGADNDDGVDQLVYQRSEYYKELYRDYMANVEMQVLKNPQALHCLQRIKPKIKNVEGGKVEYNAQYVNTIEFFQHADALEITIPRRIKEMLRPLIDMESKKAVDEHQRDLKFPKLSVADFNERLHQPIWRLYDAILYMYGRTLNSAEDFAIIRDVIDKKQNIIDHELLAGHPERMKQFHVISGELQNISEEESGRYVGEKMNDFVTKVASGAKEVKALEDLFSEAWHCRLAMSVASYITNYEEGKFLQYIEDAFKIQKLTFCSDVLCAPDAREKVIQQYNLPTIWTNKLLDLLMNNIVEPKVFCMFCETLPIVFPMITEVRTAERLLQSLHNSDIKLFCDILQSSIKENTSHHDLKSENSYHMFILGKLTALQPIYQVCSNKESGHGRYDILIKRQTKDLSDDKFKNQGVIIIELKHTKKQEDDLEKLAKEALKQIEEKEYMVEVCKTGAQKVVCIGLACCLKNLRYQIEYKDISKTG